VDDAGRMACRLTRLERQLEIARIRQLWIPVIDWSVNQPLSPLVRQVLSKAHVEIERSRTLG